MKFVKFSLLALSAIAASSALAASDPIAACADKKDKRLSKEERELAKYSCRASKAAQVLQNATWDSKAIDKKVPIKMMGAADCIIVLPGVKSGGFIFGATWGQGISSCKQADGTFGEPRFISVKNGKWMIGFEATSSDYVMIVKAKGNAQEKLEKGQIEIGGEGAAVAGKWGRKGRVSTNLKATMWTYSKSKGVALSAGVSVGGIRLNKDANKKLSESRVQNGVEDFMHVVRDMQ